LEYDPNCFVTHWACVSLFIYFVIDKREKREKISILSFCCLLLSPYETLDLLRRSCGGLLRPSPRQTLTLTIVILFALMIVLLVCRIVLFRAFRVNKLVSEHWFVLPCLQPSFIVVLLLFVQSNLFPRCAFAQSLLGDFILVSSAKIKSRHV
jgi:hypothetical protein